MLARIRDDVRTAIENDPAADSRLVVLLTYAGLQAGFTEGNPAMRAAIGAGGIGALFAAKAAIVAVGVAVRYWRPAHAGVVPLGLAIPWMLAAAINASLLV